MPSTHVACNFNLTQRLFYVDNTLESAVAGERVAQLIAKTEQLLRQRAFLRDERRRLRASTEQIDERKKALSTMQRSDWIHESVKEHHTDRHVRINIGGLVCQPSSSPHAVPPSFYLHLSITSLRCTSLR